MEHLSTTNADVLTLASELLLAYAACTEALDAATSETDAGPAILASLAFERGAIEDDVVDGVLARWVQVQQSRLSGHPGLFGGLAGLWLGARTAARHRPRLCAVVDSLGDALATYAARGAWRDDAVAWHDYDLVSGPAGVVLASTIEAPGDGCGAAMAAARHLAALCRSEGLEHLRVASYRDDEQRSWNHGRINTGLAHGVGGVVAGLTAAVRAHDVPELRDALRRASRWLARESYVDGHGLVTWPPAALEGAAPPTVPSRRQAWCYGTPGLAWVLWDGGQVLGDADLVALAEQAMRSYCAAFEPSRYLDPAPLGDALGVCHGAAGILAVADAFAVHAGLPAAAALAHALEHHLLERMDQVRRLSAMDMTLLTGASGIGAVLLTRRGGSRAWLGALALR